MKIEVREDQVLITGYVNAVERLSKPITENIGGEVKRFLERVKAGVFKDALKRNENTPVLLNHKDERQLACTEDGTAVLEEDSIGLRAEVTITDEEVVEKARDGKLVGWSFRFISNNDEFAKFGDDDVRTLNNIDLLEVSILDDEHSPAYYGTSIEARGEGSSKEEIRSELLDEIDRKAFEEHQKVWEESEEKHDAIEKKREEEKFEAIVERIAQRLFEKMNPTKKPEGKAEETNIKEFENRLAKLIK